MIDPSLDKLIYQYEVLRARLEIREHYLETIVKEIYENIGQVLSLVRVQLSLLELGSSNDKKEKIDSSGKLVGTAIRDLCNMRNRFQPEKDIIGNTKIYEAIEQEVKSVYPAAAVLYQPGNDIFRLIEWGRSLIVFNIILELISLLKKNEERQLVSIEIRRAEKDAEFIIDYSGDEIERSSMDHDKDRFNLSIRKRAKLLGGILKVKTDSNSQRKIKLVIPINGVLWDK